MLEKFKGVSNPITVIAIFAGITEVGGTIVLPFLSATKQTQYMWFLILFPAALILLFFGTLNFNHRVLYAPSDYREDSSFLAASKIKNNQITSDLDNANNGIVFVENKDINGVSQ
jgi:hypothetical protein